MVSLRWILASLMLLLVVQLVVPAALQEKGRKEEEEDTPPPVKPTVQRIEEEDEKSPAKAALPRDFATAAQQATNDRIKNLYRSLIVPQDVLLVRTPKAILIAGKQTGGPINVKPIAAYHSEFGVAGEVAYQEIDEQGKVVKEDKESLRRLDGIRYYEERAIEQVKQLLDAPVALSKYERLLAGEIAISGVLRWHESARQREIRKGDGWEKLQRQLKAQLLSVLLDQLRILVGNKSWDAGLDLARRIAETFPSKEEQDTFGPVIGDLLKKALADSDYTQDRWTDIRKRLRALQDIFPESRALEPIADSLKAQASVLFERGKQLLKEDKKAEALIVLKQADELWPDLKGLRELKLVVDDSYQVLRVAMRQMPTHLSPGWACTDAEKRCVDLLFESLVRCDPEVRAEGDTGVTWFYRSSLSDIRPKIVSLGRQFRLPREATWSDGTPLTLADVRFTWDLLKKTEGSGRGQIWTERSAEWAELFDDLRGDPTDTKRFQLRLRHGFLDPLAAMSFKILPKRTRPHPLEEDFAKNPISSGPFSYKGRKSTEGREYTSFLANPNYTARAGKEGLLRIKEIQVFAGNDPVADLRAKRIDSALDLTAEQAADLDRDMEVPMPKVGVNRRVYFLAVNNSNTALLGNPLLRLAIARAIPREKILDEHFRKGLGKKVHRVVNGPYPAGSWACDPKLSKGESVDLFDGPLAQTKLKQALDKVPGKTFQLTLKYPAGDKVLAEAMKSLASSITQTLPAVQVVAQERSPQELRSDVEETQDYDLAYYSYDYPDDGYWLSPLLGRGRGLQGNFLAYNGKIVGEAQTLAASRDFTRLKERAHSIHREWIEREMPFIPLWQLDPLYAWRKGEITTPTLAPQQIFSRIEEWRIRRK
jgi:ABC-type oligopeptide transport system substrate-binding subunit